MSDKAELAYRLAKRVTDKQSVERLQQVVIKAGNPCWATTFARYVSNANVPALQKVVIEAGDPEWATWFAKGVPSANVPALQKIIIKAGDPQWINMFPELRKRAPLSKQPSMVRGCVGKQLTQMPFQRPFPVYGDKQ